MSYSPYAPPQSAPFIDAFYRPLGWKTTVTQIGIVATVALGVAVTGATIAVGRPDPHDLAKLAVLGIGSMALNVVSLATSVMFLVWMHHAATNVRSFGHERLEFTPGWCVGWWFVPFASMVMPYRALREIWRASDPRGVRAEASLAWTASFVPSTFPLWWTTYLVSGLIGMGGALVSVFAALKKEDPSSASIIIALSQFFSIMAAVAIVSIMGQLARRQEASARKIAETPVI